MLSDEQKRGAYDRFGHAGVDPNAGGAGGMGGAGFADAFGDIFGEIFGGGGGGRRGGPQVYRGADLKYTLDISLEQAANGFDTEIRVPSWETCDVCQERKSVGEGKSESVRVENGGRRIIKKKK